MPKAYKVVKRTILFDKENPRNVYSVAPVNYGTLTTDDVARQISAESAVIFLSPNRRGCDVRSQS